MPGTGSARLKVVDAATGAPLDGADVTLNGVPFGRTGVDGLVMMTTAVGRATLTIAKDDYLLWERDLPITADLHEHLARLNPLGKSRNLVNNQGLLTAQEGEAKLILASDSSLTGTNTAVSLTWLSDKDPGLVPGPFCFIDGMSQSLRLTGALNIRLPALPRHEMVIVLPLPPGVDSAAFQLRTWTAEGSWAYPMPPSKIENGSAYFRYPASLLAARVAAANLRKVGGSSSAGETIVSLSATRPNPDSIMIVTEVRGGGTVQRNDGKSQTLLPGMQLLPGEIVKVHRGSEAVIMFPDGARMLLKENTALETGFPQTKMGTGIGLYISQFKGRMKSNRQIKSACAVSAVRGTIVSFAQKPCPNNSKLNFLDLQVPEGLATMVDQNVDVFEGKRLSCCGSLIDPELDVDNGEGDTGGDTQGGQVAVEGQWSGPYHLIYSKKRLVDYPPCTYDNAGTMTLVLGTGSGTAAITGVQVIRFPECAVVRSDDAISLPITSATMVGGKFTAVIGDQADANHILMTGTVSGSTLAGSFSVGGSGTFSLTKK